MLRIQVKSQEAMLKMKEEEKGNLKTCIEEEKRVQDVELFKLRKRLDEQKTQITGQQQYLNELQAAHESMQA